MLLLFFFAFLSGLVTIFAPCIWPLLPIILSASVSGERRKPLGIVTGIAASFTIFTLTLSYILKVIPFDPDNLRLFGVVVIAFLGVVLAVPALGKRLEGVVSRLSGFGGRFLNQKGSGFGSGFITGFALGVVWSPCAGPILATVATLAATQAVNVTVVFITISFVVGVAVPLYIFATVGQKLLTKTRALSPYTSRIQQVFGVVMILAALAIYTGYDRVLQTRLLDAFPRYGTFLNQFEKNENVKKELDKLQDPQPTSLMDQIKKTSRSVMTGLTNEGQAPEFAGIEKWLNTEDGKPLTMASLRGKVVLVDFWTYSCINCIRTLPYVTKWYEKYKDQGFVVVGVHTPEFEFEKKESNVREALVRHQITYPVAMDNDYATWQAYHNRYWPAHYLIDREGNIRQTHFGEGGYDETEQAIQDLLGGTKATEINNPQYETYAKTSETYVGYGRMERFNSVEPLQKDTAAHYSLPTVLSSGGLALAGEWNVKKEYAIPSKGAALNMQFESREVFLVMRPRAGTSSHVKVFVDGIAQSFGEDNQSGIVTVDTDRLYKLIHLDQPGKHLLRLEFQDENVEVYAFTFG